LKQLIQKLTETFSPSGYEDAIRELILSEIEPTADEVRVDALGNIIACKGTRASNGKRIMVAAHMDEIGLIATHIDENGFVRFAGIGIPAARTLPGGRVRFASGAQGVIGSEKTAKNSEVPPIEKLFIDVGATSKKDCPVEVGDVAAFERAFLDLGNRLVAKSLDNRAGVAVAIETLRRLGRGPNEVYFVFTAQEEVGVRGATVSAYGIDPQVGLSIDVTPAGDTPNSVKRDIGLGKGPAIKIKDSQMLSDPRVVAWMERASKRARISLQREVLTNGSTDARAIQLTRSGVPAGGLALPCRYVHSPSEMMDYSDIERAVELLTSMLNAPIDLG
jgi:endoglucanase